jgi:uncharacterized protein (DUF433 family)
MADKWIVADADHLGGKPRVAGTRIPISFVLESLALGKSIKQIVTAYPSLTEESVKGALMELARSKQFAGP